MHSNVALIGGKKCHIIQRELADDNPRVYLKCAGGGVTLCSTGSFFCVGTWEEASSQIAGNCNLVTEEMARALIEYGN